MIETGLVTLVQQQADRRFAVGVRGEGSVIGEHALMGDPDLPGNGIEALLPTRIRWLEEPSASDGTTTTLALAVIAARTRLHGVACQKRRQSIPQQIAQWLDLSDCSALGDPGNGSARLTHKSDATLVGTPRNAVSRTLAEFSPRPFFQRPDADSIVLNKPALETFARSGLVADLTACRDRLRHSEVTLPP